VQISGNFGILGKIEAASKSSCVLKNAAARRWGFVQKTQRSVMWTMYQITLLLR
jgi:hypothetical protein